MGKYNAAREGDAIAHTASKGWLIAGAIGGAIIGAAVVVATGGTALVAIAAVSAGACAAGGLGEVLGSMSWAPRHTTGELVGGSHNVFINSRAAIRAHLSSGKCDEHSGSLQVVAEGSVRVYINSWPAARINDLLTCSAEIHSGSPNVFFGGSKFATDEVSPEVPDWVNWAMLGIGVAALVVLASPAIASLSTLGGLGGSYGGSYLGGKWYGEGSDGQKWAMLLGGLIGSAIGGKGGMKFDGWRAGRYAKANGVPVRGGGSSLNNNFDRFHKEDLILSANKPINDQGLSEVARAWEKHAGRPGSVFKPLKGDIVQKNDLANQFVSDLLNNKSTIKTDLSRGGVEYRLPDGRGVRYDSDGSFSGVLDPKK